MTSAVSVVHRLSDDISDSSSNSSGDGDVDPPSRGRCPANGRDGWFQIVGEVLQCVSSVGLPFSRNAGPRRRLATWAKVGDGSVVLSGEAVYPVVLAETFHSENSCVSGTCRWKAVVGADVVHH